MRLSLPEYTFKNCRRGEQPTFQIVGALQAA
jgi:hypothetical protein